VGTPTDDVERRRSKPYAERTGARYWWYRRRGVACDPPSLALLTDEEWELLEAWYDETDSKGLAGECGIPAIALLEALIVGGPISRVVQLGHFAGFSALLLGFALRRMACSRSLFSIDLDPGQSAFAEAWIVRAKLEDHVRIATGDSRDVAMPRAAADWLGGGAQLVFVDSSHRYGETLEELDLWYDQLAGGGLILLHDASIFAQNFDSTGQGGVHRAAREWTARRGVPALLLNADLVAGTAPERLVYGDPCGLAIIQKPYGQEQGGRSS